MTKVTEFILPKPSRWGQTYDITGPCTVSYPGMKTVWLDYSEGCAFVACSLPDDEGLMWCPMGRYSG